MSSPAISTPHVTELKVRFNELDLYGHVNHAAYVSYCEHARTEALESIGLAIEEMVTKGFQIVVMEIQVSYKRPAVASDILHIDTWVTELRRASTRWSQRIRRGDDICVTLDLRAAVTDIAGKPTRPPAWMFERLEALVPTAEP